MGGGGGGGTPRGIPWLVGGPPGGGGGNDIILFVRPGDGGTKPRFATSITEAETVRCPGWPWGGPCARTAPGGLEVGTKLGGTKFAGDPVSALV